jgi:hypothetical protein
VVAHRDGEVVDDLEDVLVEPVVRRNCSVPNVTARTVPPMFTPTLTSGARTGTTRSSRIVL